MTALPHETPDPAVGPALTKGESPGRDHTPPTGAVVASTPNDAPPRLADPLLDILADALDDLERTRIANENRLRQLTRTEVDKDGGERGFGLSADVPEVARLAGIVAALADLEHQATLNLQRQMRAHPLHPWVKAARGVGLKQAARLLSAIGDPYWNTLHDRPRTVSELWAYCGLHVLPADRVNNVARDRHVGGDQTSNPGHLAGDAHTSSAGVAAKRRKGQRANWSNTAKMRAFRIAEKVIQCGNPTYRALYDARRAHTAVTRPEWTAGHSHNDALRIVAKAVLKDMWIEARRLHTE